MSVNSAMTAIADKIRALLGVSGTMGLDAMATHLETERSNIASAFAAVGSKGGTVPGSQVSGNLASAIGTISTGVTVQRASGTFTTSSSGNATVNCGFQPDVVYIQAGAYDSIQYHLAYVFSEHGASNAGNVAWNETYNSIEAQASRTSTGFTITMTAYSEDWADSAVSRATFNYVAIKYTE